MAFFITPQIIVDQLSNEGYNILSYRGNLKRSIERVRFCDSDECQNMAETNTLYIVRDGQLDFCGGELLAIYISHNDIAHSLLGTRTIIVLEGDDSDILQVYNLIEKLLFTYSQWNKHMEEAVIQGDFQRLAQLGREIFHNPLFVHDDRFNYVMKQSWIAGQTIPEYNRRSGLGMVPVDVIDELWKSKAYQKTLNAHGAQLYEDYRIDSYRVLYVNIWENEEYRGRLCIDEINSPLLPGQFPLAEFYADCIRQAISNRTDMINKRFTDLEQGLASLLGSDTGNLETVGELLHSIGWDGQDQYLLCLIKSEALSNEMAKAICYDIENRNPESCAFALNHRIYILFNMSYEKRKVAAICQTLYEKSLRENDVLLISDPFWGIGHILSAKKQLSALWEWHELNHSRCQDKWYSFGKYALKIILNFGVSNCGYEALQPQAIEQLKAYDMQNNTDLLHSLFYFLKNSGNITKAAEDLCIHRTTLIYRMERIRKITGIDVDDYETRLYLGLFLLDYPTL